MNESPTQDRTIKLTLRWVLFGIILMVAFGVLGGIVGSLWFSPTLPPLTNTDGQQLVSTVQELTISPGIARSEMIERASRSVVVIGIADADPPDLRATAVAVTNDGLLATAATLPSDDLVAYDADGQVLPVNRVGEDELFGITYLRLPNSVVVPLDLRPTDAPVGQTLTALTGEEESLAPAVADFLIESYTLPEAAAPAGLQRQLHGNSVALVGPGQRGTPLVDEEGNLAGLLMDADTGIAIPVSHVRESFDRVAKDERERDPFAELGVRVRYEFSNPTPDAAATFQATVSNVTPDGPAAAAGIRVGDSITHVGETALTWETSVAGLLARQLPFTVTIERQETSQNITIQDNPEQS